jgi:hypothetical protein
MLTNPEYTHTDPAWLIGLAVIAWALFAAQTIAHKRRNNPRPPIGTRTRKGNPPA